MLAIFDVDGTLYDSEPSVARCNAHAFNAIGWTFPAGVDAAEYILRELPGGGSNPKFRAIAAYLGKDFDPDVYETFKAAQDAAAIRAMGEAKATMFENVKATLLHIKRDFRLAVATNNPSHLAYPVLTHEGLIDVFTRAHVLAPDLMVPAQEASVPYARKKYQKPSPAMLLAHMHRHNADPADCFMLGDTDNDILAANAAGMHAIGFLNAARPNAKNEQKMRDAGAHAFMQAWSPQAWDEAVSQARRAAGMRTPALA